MALADLADWKTHVASPAQRVYVNKAATTTTAGRSYTLWATTPDAGAAPTTAAVPSRTITGAVGQVNPTNNLHVLDVPAISAGQNGVLVLCDRLSHQGGLSGTAAGAQTTNLPTAALTRYTSGVGVMLALDIYSAVGSTGTTVTASYTDQGGGGGTTQPVVFGGSNHREAGRRVMLNLASGDYGVQAVASVTLAGTTGAAGNFGVTLFRPLLYIPHTQEPNRVLQRLNGLMGLGGQLSEILDDACLEWMWLANGTTTGLIQGVLSLADV